MPQRETKFPDFYKCRTLHWLRPSDLISDEELFSLEDALRRFYVNPPNGYQETAAQMNQDLSNPEHVLHRRIISLSEKDWKVLDVGCGPATSCHLFCERGARYTGVDLTLEQLEINRRRHPHAQFVALHWRDLSALKSQFDLVTSFFVLEHIVRPREFLRSSVSCVRRGGLLAVLCPNFLGMRYLPSQYFFGTSPGGLKAKIRGRRWRDVADEVWSRYVRYPLLMRCASQLAKEHGAWLINLRPVCLDVQEWGLDWDAVYMVSEDEVAGYVESLGFEIVERGDRLRHAEAAAGYPDFCYVVGRKTE